MSEKDVLSPVTKYEHFINDVLRADLRHVLDKRDQVVTTMAEYTQLKESLPTLSNRNLSTQVDLGRGFYVQAEVGKLTHAYVDIGFSGLHVQMTPEETTAFVDKKIELLRLRSERLSNEAARINSHIRVALDMLRSLNQIDTVDHSEGRDLTL